MSTAMYLRCEQLTLTKMSRGLVLSQNGAGNFWLFDGADALYRVSRDAALRLIESGCVVRDFENSGAFGFNYKPSGKPCSS